MMVKKEFLKYWDDVLRMHPSLYSYKLEKNYMVFTRIQGAYEMSIMFELYPVYQELRRSGNVFSIKYFDDFILKLLDGCAIGADNIRRYFHTGAAIIPDAAITKTLKYNSREDVETMYLKILKHFDTFEEWFVKPYSNFCALADVMKNRAYLEKQKFWHPSTPFEERPKEIGTYGGAPLSSFHKLTVLYLGEQYEAYEAFKEGMRDHFARFGDIEPEKAHEVVPRLHALDQLTAGLEGDEHKDTIAMLRALRYSEELIVNSQHINKNKKNTPSISS